MNRLPEHESPQLQLFDLAGRSVLVLGLGESGVAMARWAASRGAMLRVADTRSARVDDLPSAARLAQIPGEVAYVGGPFSADWLQGIDLVAWSPGLSIERGESAAFYALARERNIPVLGELDLFVQALAMMRETGYSPRLVAITGTNGKTTTTALAAHLFAATGKTVRAAGNIGPAMLVALLEALEAKALPDIWVLELSSFQLAVSRGFEPDAASILNLTEDHLDWHHSMAMYAAAKRRLFGPATWVVYNRADAATMPPPKERIALSARATRRAPEEPIRSSSFGLDNPLAAGDFGLVREGGMEWLAQAQAEESLPGRRRDEGQALHVRRLMPVEALRLAGRHNQANVMAALALGAAIGLPLAPMLRAIGDYAGEAHRCELLAVIDEVHYYDDSKGTNVGATVAALVGLGMPSILIAGGDGKGQDFSPLAPAVAGHARAVLLIGRDAPLIRQAIEGCGVPIEDCASLEQAVERGQQLAKPGQAVLLSPACASFDMFTSYKHRGETFARAVRECADRAGQPLELAC